MPGFRGTDWWCGYLVNIKHEQSIRIVLDERGNLKLFYLSQAQGTSHTFFRKTQPWSMGFGT